MTTELVQIDWGNYLVILKHLPELILDKYQFLPSTPDEKKAVEGHKAAYVTLAQWMDYLVPGDKPPDPDLFFTSKVNLKHRATASKAVLDLAVELLPRVGALQEYFVTPSDIWFAWEVDLLHQAMLKSGLLTGSPDLAMSKPKLEGFTKDFDHLTQALGSSRLNISKPAQGSATELIIGWSARLAEEDIGFRSSGALRQFQKTATAHLRSLRRNRELRVSLLEDGKELPKDRNRPRQSKKSKGFL